MAVDEEEVPRLLNLYERGKENGAKDLKLLDKHEIKDIEPNCEVRNLRCSSVCLPVCVYRNKDCLFPIGCSSYSLASYRYCGLG